MAAFAEVDSDRIRTDLPVPSLRSNFRWTFVGNVVYSACQWGMISALAKLGNAALVGRFALGLAITAPVFMFTSLQLRGVQATDARSEFAFADYFTLRILGSFIGLLAVVLIVVSGRYDWGTGAVIVLAGLSKAFESLSDVVAGLLQKVERLNRVSISLMVRGGLSLPAFAGVFWITHNLIATCAALVAIWSLVFAIYDVRQACAVLEPNEGFFAFRWSHLKQLAILSAPLGIVMTMNSLNVNIPRYILEHSLGEANLGIFASLAYLLVAISVVINALGQAVSSRLSRMFADGELHRFRSLLFRLEGFALLVLIAGPPVARLVGGPLLTFLYRPEYSRHVDLFVIMVATAGVLSISSFLGYANTAARNFRLQVPVICSSTGATTLCAFILIPRFGMTGGAFALLIGAGVQLTGAAVILRWQLNRRSRQLEDACAFSK
jgi:O-antigen/teichoic acid export membrane protein